MSVDEAIKDALKHVLSADGGSGASVDDPRRLGPIHPLLAPAMEQMLISGIYGERDRDWFDDGREYYHNDHVCEQKIRLSSSAKPKPEWASPGRVYSMFFEVSELTETAPVPDELKKSASDAAAQMRVPDASFVSQFPLTAVKGQTAQEAARVIAGYLAQAQAEGWAIGSATALVDGWRNEYELTKDGEKAIMGFDMRPSLFTDLRLRLVALTLIAGTPKLEEVIRNFESSLPWPEAFAAAGLSFVDTSEKKSNRLERPLKQRQSTADIFYETRSRTIGWNGEALNRLMHQEVRLVGRNSDLEMLASDILFLLVSAKSNGWHGAQHLFQQVPIGFTSTLEDGHTVNDLDALELSSVLSRITSLIQDRNNPALKTAQSLAAFASKNGFCIRILTPNVPQGRTTPTTHTDDAENAHTSARQSKRFGEIIAFLGLVLAIGVGTYQHSLTVGIIVFCIAAIVFNAVDNIRK